MAVPDETIHPTSPFARVEALSSFGDDLLYTSVDLMNKDISMVLLRMGVYYVSGATLLQSYITAAGVPWETLDRDGREQVGVTITKITRREGWKKLLKALRQRMTEKAVMRLDELKVYLSAAVKTPISEIDEVSPLCQEKKVETTYKHTGERVEKTTYKAVSKLQAAKQLSALMGWDIKEIQSEGGEGGVMVVPSKSENLDDWQQSARASQKNLMEDALAST